MRTYNICFISSPLPPFPPPHPLGPRQLLRPRCHRVRGGAPAALDQGHAGPVGVLSTEETLDHAHERGDADAGAQEDHRAAIAGGIHGS